MNPLHLKYLICPETGKELSLVNEVIENGKIKEGTLLETTSGKKYPITNFIPRFVPLENYSDSFGLQWNIHNRTQYDETSQHDLSRTRFYEQTRWAKYLKNELILEAGSGSGRFSKYPVESGAMVISFDYSNAVEANYRSNGQMQNLLIVQASIYDMPFKKGSFDRVFCIGVLQHTPDPEASFYKLIEMIKPRGFICTDIYLKNFAKVFSTPKYFVRLFTKGKPPEKLYRNIVRYVDFMWPLARLISKIPKIGKMINWRLLVADYSQDLPNADEQTIKQWAYLDTMDMLSPAYDIPATKNAYYKWHKKAHLEEIDVHYGYNGIEARARKK
jgi:SAM-dependent methyltransferase